MTLFTLEGDIKIWGAVLHSNMVIQIILGFCGEIGTLGTKQCSNKTSLLVTYSIVSCCLGTTIFTCNFFFSDYRKHFIYSSLTE